MKAKCEAAYKEFWTVQEVIHHKPSIITITLLFLTMRVQLEDRNVKPVLATLQNNYKEWHLVPGTGRGDYAF